MKKAITIISIAIVVLLVVELAFMFLPYFRMAFIKSLDMKNEKYLEPTDFSLVDLMWLHTEQMCKVFKRDIGKDFSVNPNLVSWVLAFIFSVLTIVLHFLKFANDRSKYETTSAAVIRFFVHTGPFAIAYFCADALRTSQILKMGNYNIALAIMAVAAVVAALSLARLVLTFLPKFQKKKVAA